MTDTFRAVLVNEAEVLRQLEKAGLVVKDVLEQATLAGAKVVLEAAEPKAPGPHIGMDVSMKRKEKVVVEVGPDEDHWHYRFFETGAQPHEIKPRSKEALLIEGNIYAERVAHMGMAARPFLRPALDSNKDEIVAAIGKVIEEKLKAIARS